jgi:hypothetical protein
MNTDTDTYQLWPLVLIIEDVYVSQSAEYVLNAVAAFDSETIAISFTCDAFAAEMDAHNRRN